MWNESKFISITVWCLIGSRILSIISILNSYVLDNTHKINFETSKNNREKCRNKKLHFCLNFYITLNLVGTKKGIKGICLFSLKLSIFWRRKKSLNFGCINFMTNSSCQLSMELKIFLCSISVLKLNFPLKHNFKCLTCINFLMPAGFNYHNWQTISYHFCFVNRQFDSYLYTIPLVENKFIFGFMYKLVIF